MFVLLVAAVPVAAYLVLRWYAYDNWFVTVQGTQIVVKQGQPGGVLWFQPKVVDATGLSTSQIPTAAVHAVQGGVQEPSLSSAQKYVANLYSEAHPIATTPTTSSTSTTIQGVTTTTSAPAAATTTTLPSVPAGGAP